MTVHPEQEFFRRAGAAWLWFGMLAAPLAFLLNLQVSYLLVQVVCGTGRHSVLHLVSLGALLLAAAAGLSAWRNWRRATRLGPGGAEGVVPRSRFMAAVGLLTSGLFMLAIVALWLPTLVLGPCQR